MQEARGGGGRWCPCPLCPDLAIWDPLKPVCNEGLWGRVGDPRPPSSPLLSPPGAPLPPTETQQLLFGSDDKCFTRMTPVLLLLAKSRQEEEEAALAPSSYLSADGVVDMAPYPQLRSVALATAMEKHRGWEPGERGAAPALLLQDCGGRMWGKACWDPWGTWGPRDPPCVLLAAHPRPGPRSCHPPPPRAKPTLRPQCPAAAASSWAS